MDQAEIFEAIKVEVNTLRQLNNNHCAEILGSYFLLDKIYSFCIVMPWCDFSLENLYKKDHIPDVPPETLKEFNNENFAIKTIICLSNAVYYLHNIAKLKDLDLKPSNILFKKEQGEYVVKICDFGITSKLSKNSLIGMQNMTKRYLNFVQVNYLAMILNFINHLSKKIINHIAVVMIFSLWGLSF